jgi:hypothetical protein
MAIPDYVERRIVVEFGRQYVYLYMTTGDGKLIADREESFKQPYRVDAKEAADDAVDAWDVLYDHLNDLLNWPLQEGGDDEPESGDEED